MKQIGLALSNFHNSNNRFPGSGELDVTTPATGSTHTVSGWSFLVKILPYIDIGSMYSTSKSTAVIRARRHFRAAAPPRTALPPAMQRRSGSRVTFAQAIRIPRWKTDQRHADGCRDEL